MTRGITLWRVSNYACLEGVGGLYVSGRWHSKGHPIVYCSEDPSTALLETLVHLEIDGEDRPETFQVLKIESLGEVSIEQVNMEELGSDWRGDLPRTRAAGDKWLQSRESLLFEVPSVLVPERRNYLINPAHLEIGMLRISVPYTHPFDQRFVR